MKDIKLGDKVFRGIDPESTTNFESALECIVIALKVLRSIDLDGKEIEEVLECEVTYGTLDDDEYIKVGHLFPTKEEATKFMRKRLEGKIEKLDDKLKQYKELLK